MARQKNNAQGRPIVLVFLGLLGLGILIAWLLRGADIILFNPKGHIAREQTELLILSALVLCVIGVPTLAVLYSIAWKYRESNTQAKRDTRVYHGAKFTFFIWAVPIAFFLLLSVVMWKATHRLEPQKAIASDVKPLTIQVIALRWKWLFIYPEQQVASVNYVELPADTPVRFDLTADEAPMSSFWIPHLAGQLYAMTGHVNPLNLIASEPGEYTGRSAEVNGHGFAGMTFTTKVTTRGDFDRWAESTRQTAPLLDDAAYQQLLEPSEAHPIGYYANAAPDLYVKVVQKYMGAHGDHGASREGHE